MQLGADALGHSAFAAVGEDLADTVDADNDLVGHGAQGHALPGVAIVGVFADQQGAYLIHLSLIGGGEHILANAVQDRNVVRQIRFRRKPGSGLQFDQEHDTVIDNADIFHIAAFVDAGAIPMFFEGADALGLAPDLVVQGLGAV